MLRKRIITCLDLKDGRVVKGINFIDLVDAGDPVEVAKRYNEMGADEIVFLDITATHEKRESMFDVIERASREVFLPLTVGGGIKSLEDISTILSCGADKISINSSAVENPKLISKAAEKFGSQCIVVAIDCKRQIGGDYHVFLAGGRIDSGLDALEWAQKAESLGAGEILLTSMDTDGTRAGFAIEITNRIASSVNIPVIASGGAGNMQHFLQVFQEGKADAALAASLFHYKELEIDTLKKYLTENGVCVRRRI